MASGDICEFEPAATLRSSKSKFAKFSKSICEVCNSSLTQPDDYAYEKLSTAIRESMDAGREPFEVIDDLPWETEAESIDCLRYFAKLIGCFASEKNAPIPSKLARFVRRDSSDGAMTCTIFSDIDVKAQIKGEGGETSSYVFHKGLQLTFDPKSCLPVSYCGGVGIDWALLRFDYHFDEFEVAELLCTYSEFVDEMWKSAMSGDGMAGLPTSPSASAHATSYKNQ